MWEEDLWYFGQSCLSPYCNQFQLPDMESKKRWLYTVTWVVSRFGPVFEYMEQTVQHAEKGIRPWSSGNPSRHSG